MTACSFGYGLDTHTSVSFKEADVIRRERSGGVYHFEVRTKEVRGYLSEVSTFVFGGSRYHKSLEILYLLNCPLVVVLLETVVKNGQREKKRLVL